MCIHALLHGHLHSPVELLVPRIFRHLGQINLPYKRVVLSQYNSALICIPFYSAILVDNSCAIVCLGRACTILANSTARLFVLETGQLQYFVR